MTDLQHCVIVGASHAASHLAFSLRKLKWTGAITLIGDEPHVPYHRPPLSKNYLTGNKTLQQMLLKPAATYASANIDLKLSTRVDGIDRQAKTITLSGGEKIAYSHLVLATGARPRALPVDGSDLNGVCYLRDADDIESIKGYVAPGASAVIIGGGYIGLEAAATLRQLEMQVTVLESLDRVLQRVTSPEISAFFERVHGEEGVDLRTTSQVTSITGDGAVTGVALSSGEVIDARLVIVGIGVIPNTALAAESGLDIDNGIVVDEYGVTSDPSIFACGDCANAYHSFYQQRLRLESVQNANDLALTVARKICGVAEPYSSVPWFWSDQFDVKLQIAGLQNGHNSVVYRGAADTGRKFSALYLAGSTLLSVDAINNPQDFVFAKKLIGERAEMDIDKLRDTDNKLSDCRLV